MKVINLFAGPGAGKSLISAGVFCELKKSFSNVELRTEYAKDLVYEQRNDILKTDQLYILAKQNRKLKTLLTNNIEYVVTDSPIFLSLIYNNPDNLNQDIFEKLVLELHHKYDNLNFFLERNPNYNFEKSGRIHTDINECKQLDQQIKDKLNQHQINYISIKNNTRTIDKIVSKIYEERLN